MTKKITIKDIALEAGVSPSLVSFALSNASGKGRKHYNVNKQTAERILEIARKYDFTPNNIARNLRTKRSHTVGVIFTDISNQFFANIARHIEDVANLNSYTAIFASTYENPDRLKAAVSLMIDNGVDGMIIVPCYGCHDTLTHVLEKKFPTVLIDRDCIELPSVVLDNAKASRMAVLSLFNEGYKKIIMFSYDMRVSNIEERERGYVNTMTELGLEDNINIYQCSFSDLEGSMRAKMVTIDFKDVDAILFATNSIAFSGICYMHEIGISVPEDVDIVSFDESEFFKIAKSHTHYIRQPIKEFANKSFEMLLSVIEGKELEEKHVVLQPELF